jgi:hypothetical protein
MEVWVGWFDSKIVGLALERFFESDIFCVEKSELILLITKYLQKWNPITITIISHWF